MKLNLKKILELLKKLRICVGKQAVVITDLTDDATDKKVEAVVDKIEDVIEMVENVIESSAAVLPELPPSPTPESKVETKSE
jgi:hypothetical protein